jgi:hypothetical protein
MQVSRHNGYFYDKAKLTSGKPIAAGVDGDRYIP